MKDTDVTLLLARAMQVVRIQPLYYPDVVHQLRQRYGFVVTPQEPSELYPQNGVLTFGHGRLALTDRTIVISRLDAHRNGIVVEVETSTDDAEEVLNDLSRFAKSTFNLDLDQSISRMFVSNLEVILDTDLDQAVPRLRPAFDFLLGEMTKLAPRAPIPLGLNTLSFFTDTSRFNVPCDIKIERRQGRPWEDRVYFAQAPLRTAVHKQFLQVFEDAISASN